MKRGKRVIAMLLTLFVLVGLMSMNTFAANEKYEEVHKAESLEKWASVHVYSVNGGGQVEVTASNRNDKFVVYREYTANPNEGWVFKSWTYEQMVGGKDLGNYYFISPVSKREVYSFSNSSKEYYKPYEKGNTISVNRLLSGTPCTPITYNLYANFNPTIVATKEGEGTINPVGITEVEYGDNQSYIIEAEDGNLIDSIEIDGTKLPDVRGRKNYTYTFENVIEPHKIHVVFAETYTVRYTDGVDNEEIFADQIYADNLYGVATPMFKGTPEREGYVFNGWKPEVAETVTGDVTYIAAWGEDKNNNGQDDAIEEKYTVRYTDGVDGEEIFADQIYPDNLYGAVTPTFKGTPEREGYVFNGWQPEVAETVTGDVTYRATWSEKVTDNDNQGNVNNDKDNNNVTDANKTGDKAATPKTGDTANVGMYIFMFVTSGVILAVFMILKRRRYFK